VSDRDLHEALQRISALEAKVSNLYKALNRAEPLLDDLIDADADPEVIALIQQNREIEAVKRYRELTGTGLREAKEAVDRIAVMYTGR
jgi:ribosomal protein L7/L12